MPSTTHASSRRVLRIVWWRTIGARFVLPGAVLLPAVAATADPVAGLDDETSTLDQTIDPDQEVAADVAELTAGHIDIGPRFVDDVWTLMIHDDAQHDDDTEDSVWRHPDDTVLRVHDTGVLEVPDGDAYAFLGVDGGAPVYVVPQTQDPEVIWLGWNTQDPEVMDTIDRGVTLSLTGVEGPGHLVVYLQSGAFDEPDVLWDSRVEEDQPAWIPVNVHAHANWVFSEPGSYLVSMEVSADLVDRSEVTDTQALRFAVGDEVDTDEVLAATPAGAIDDDDGAIDDDNATEGASDAGDGVDASNDAGGGDDVEDLTVAGEDEDGGLSLIAVLVGGLALVVIGVGAVVGLRSRSARRQALGDRSGS